MKFFFSRSRDSNMHDPTLTNSQNLTPNFPLLPAENLIAHDIVSKLLGLKCTLTNFRFILEYNPNLYADLKIGQRQYLGQRKRTSDFTKLTSNNQKIKNFTGRSWIDVRSFEVETIKWYLPKTAKSKFSTILPLSRSKPSSGTSQKPQNRCFR